MKWINTLSLNWQPLLIPPPILPKVNIWILVHPSIWCIQILKYEIHINKYSENLPTVSKIFFLNWAWGMSNSCKLTYISLLLFVIPWQTITSFHDCFWQSVILKLVVAVEGKWKKLYDQTSSLPFTFTTKVLQFPCITTTKLLPFPCRTTTKYKKKFNTKLIN